MRRPRQETISLAANETKPVPVRGRWLLILANTVASVDVAFDDNDFAPMDAGIPYPATEGAFELLRFRETTGAAATIRFVASESQMPDTRGGTLAAAMAASLASIDADTDNLATIDGDTGNIAADTALMIPASTATPFGLAAVAQTGIGSTQVVAAAAANKWVSVQADVGNAGAVYVGFVAGVTAANAPIRLGPGDSWREEWAGDVYACSDAGTEQVRAYVIATA